MRKQLQQLEEAKTEAEETLAKRKATYDERTDNWKETYKAKRYQYRTEDLERFIDSLLDAIDSLNSYLD
tara:strand:- start:1199 stop:1405 length:207 start_codon:yes stop_codon:yes gene_type:complete